MNPCTLVGGFWFEAGRFSFGLCIAAVVGLVVFVTLVWRRK